MTRKNVGWVLVAIGLFMLFKMVRVSSFGFLRIGRVSTASLVLILLIISAVAVVVNKNRITVGCFGACVAMLVVSLLLGTNLTFGYASLIDILLAFVPIVVGIGILFKDARDKSNKSNRE